MKRKFCLFFMFFIISEIQAQWDYGFDFSKAGTAGLQFLKIGVGARESAMGEAALGISKGANAIFWNPAGIAYAAQREATFSYTEWMLNISHSATAITMNVKKVGTVGLSLIYMGVPEFQETTVQAQDGTGRKVSAYDLGIGLAIARRFTWSLNNSAISTRSSSDWRRVSWFAVPPPRRSSFNATA